nr:unnamed protein product [Callosobruchus analis]
MYYQHQTEGEVEDWTEEQPAATSPKEPKSPEVVEEEPKTPPKSEPEETAPKIRLKANLATDPALLPQFGALKTQLEPNQSPTEYLASLPPAIQSAIASRAFFLPSLISPAVEAAAPVRQAESVEPRQPAGVVLFVVEEVQAQITKNHPSADEKIAALCFEVIPPLSGYTDTILQMHNNKLQKAPEQSRENEM